MPPKKNQPATAPKHPPNKRRAVTLAKDADIVLTKCRELRDSLRNKSEDASEDDEWDVSSSEEDTKDDLKKKKGVKTQRISLAELKRATVGDDGDKKTIVEVAEMSSTQVVEGIENVSVKIARQILAKQVRFH